MGLDPSGRTDQLVDLQRTISVLSLNNKYRYRATVFALIGWTAGYFGIVIVMKCHIEPRFDPRHVSKILFSALERG